MLTPSTMASADDEVFPFNSPMTSPRGIELLGVPLSSVLSEKSPCLTDVAAMQLDLPVLEHPHANCNWTAWTPSQTEFGKQNLFSTSSTFCTITDTHDGGDTLHAFLLHFTQGRFACLGAGYVGGPTMTVLAHACPNAKVAVADTNPDRIQAWKSEVLPISELGLDALVQEHRGKNLVFSSDCGEIIKTHDVIFICVDTPPKRAGFGRGNAADTAALEAAARMIATHAESSKIVVVKSTVPVKTCHALKRILVANVKHPNAHFVVLSNPEFLAEGTAIKNLLAPDRVLVGGDLDCPIGSWAARHIRDVYASWVEPHRIIVTKTESAELAKLVANALLAQRLSSINAVAMLCEQVGADIHQIAQAVGSDSRIGHNYLRASVGYGGHCLPKDVNALASLCNTYGLAVLGDYWRSVNQVNDLQKERFARTIVETLFNSVRNKKLAIFGFSFKKDTADTRATPAAGVCLALLAEGAHVYVYDPWVKPETGYSELEAALVNLTKSTMASTSYLSNVASSVTKDTLFSHLHFSGSAVDAVTGADAIVVLTDWDVFKTYNYKEFYNVMRRPAFIFDGRNCLNLADLRPIGFQTYRIGEGKACCLS